MHSLFHLYSIKRLSDTYDKIMLVMFPGKTKLAVFIARITPMRVLIVLAGIYLFFIVCYFVLASLSNGLNMDTYAADGTLQLYNPMRRLLEGQVIGKDFPFFHGVGVPLLHFPLFYLLGHNVFAADATKWLMSPLIFLAASFIFFWAFFRKPSYSFIATALLTIVSLVYVDVVWPGNSLLGIRTTFPVIVAAFLLWRPYVIIRLKKHTISLYHPIVWLLLALSVACGTEQGLAAIVAYIIVEVIRAIRSSTPFQQWWWRGVLKVIGISAVVYVVLSVLTLGHANETLHYALIDIPKDQGWYFGTPPNDFLAWNTLDYIFDKKVLFFVPILLLGALAFGIGAWRKILSHREVYVFSFLVTYGIVVFFASITGYWAPNAQLVPLDRVFSLIAVALIIRVCISYIQSLMHTSRSRAHYIALAFYAALFITFSWYIYQAYHQVKSFPVHQILHQVKDARHAPDGTYVSSYWRKRIDAFAPYIPQGARIWSTYTGVYDSMRGQLNGSTGGEDYIIHALGPERRDQYAKDFIAQKPDFAITLKPSYFQYEEWLWDRHWSFYQQLVTHYRVIADNDSHILWQRLPDSQATAPGAVTPLRQTNDGQYQISPGASDHVRLYAVTVNYNIKKTIPLATKISRYLMTISGSSVQRFAAALPPYESSWQFPVILAPGDTSATITPATQGLGPKSQLNIISISYQEVPLSDTNGYPYYDSYCSFGGTLTYPAMGSQYHHLRCTPEHLTLEYFQSHQATDVFSIQ